MEKLLNNITKVVVYLIMALGVAFTVWTIAKGSELTLDNMELVDKVLNPYFGVSFVTFLIAFAAAVLFPLGQMFMNPKAAIKTGISLAVLGVIYLISWSLASDNNVGKYFTENHITPAQSQFIGSLIYIAYILGALAFLSIIVSGVLGMLSKR